MKAHRRAWMTTLAAALLAGTTARGGTAIYDNGWSGGSGSGGAPTSEDGVIMRAGNLLWDASLPTTVAGWVQEAGYANTVTFDTRYPGQGTFTNFTITGDCVISNGVWRHGNNSNAEKYNLTVTVQGRFDLQSNGVINVDGLGWDPNLGPGRATGSADAGSHGGVGCANYTFKSPGYPTYGSIASPTNLGSGSCSPGGAGGGAIRLVVRGTASIEGTVSANGADYSGQWYSSGSGGSVWLTASNLTGSGTIRANGGTAAEGGGGGGGRVAVILTGSDSFGTVALTAYGGVKGTGGGRQYGGAGTVYRETQSDTPGRGELIVDNADRVNTSTYVATSLSGVRAVTADFARVTLRNAGVLRIDADDALDLRNTTITGDSSDGNDGIQIYGGAILTPDAFAFSNYFVRLHQAGCAFDPAASLTVGTNATLTVNHPHAFSGDLVVAAGGTMTHDRNTTTEAFKLNLAVGGGLTVHAGGVVDVMGRGFQAGSGTGAGTYNIGGASHGGRGSIYSPDPGVSGPTYGSIVSPTNLGSGAYGAGPGGGAVKLAVTEGAVVNGLITADGAAAGSSSWACGGAGGSIWLTAESLSGTGTIRADGGAAGTSAGGGSGGGRIAVTLATGSAVGDVTITAYGSKRATSSYGRVHGGAGTVYLRLAGVAADAGTLIVDNADRLPAESDETEISSLVSGTAVGDVILRSNAKLQINTNQSLTVSGSWSNGAVFVAQTGAKVEFVGTNTATVQGNSAFHTLVCTNPFKTVYFQAGSVSTVGGTLTLRGSTESNLTLRSTSSPAQWSLAVAGGAVQSVEYVDVKDSNASDADITAAHSHDAGNNTNWDFPSGAQTNTWTGTVSTDWGAGANWSLGRAPIEADAAVVISAAATYQPVLDRDDRSVNLFEIENGAGLSLAGHPFLVNGDARIAGALTAVGTETVTFKGDVDFTGGSFTPAQSTLLLARTAAQAFTADGASCYRLTARNGGRTITFTDAMRAEYYRCESVDAVYGGDFSAREFRVHSSGGAVTQTFHAASAYAVEELYLLGQTGSTQYLRGSGGAWALNVSRLAHVRHVDVAHSDASAGLTVYPLNSTDSGSNMNWTFGADVKQWTGVGGSSFGEATSWDPPGVPGSGTRVVIDDPDGVTLSSPATVCSLTVGGGTGSVFTVNAALTVLEDLKVARHATVSLNRPGNTVSNDVWVFEGGTLTHEQNATTEANKIELWVGGDLSLAAGAAVNVTAKGYAPNAGPGGGTQNGTASSHGGRGSPYGADHPLGTYGSMASPTNLGSGSFTGGRGGGAVRLTVAGATSLDGEMVADGEEYVGTWMCGGAGGSVWLTTGSLTGSGTISAAGGATISTYGGGAGGGRISVRLTSGAAFGSVTMRANGSLRATASNSRIHGGAGTIYRETAAQAGGRGTVTVANNGASPSASARTYILPEQLIVPDEAVQAEVRVEGSGAVTFTTNTALTALNVASINEIIDLGGSAVTTKVSALLRFNGVEYTRGGLYSVADWNGYETPANVSGDGVIQFTRKPAGTIITIR